jgi:hypothetical protein
LIAGAACFSPVRLINLPQREPWRARLLARTTTRRLPPRLRRRLTGPSDGGGFDDVRESSRGTASNSATRRVKHLDKRVPIRQRRLNPATRSSSSARSGSKTTTSMPQTTRKINPCESKNQLNIYKYLGKSTVV